MRSVLHSRMEIVTFHRIYVLSARGVVRYVGVTGGSEQDRLEHHLYEAKSGIRNHRCNWLRSLKSKRPQVEVVEWIRPEDRDERETYWIALFRAYGHDLVNETDGGDGTRGYVFTPEVCQKISKAITGLKKSPECRAKMSASHKGRPKTPEHRKAMSEAQKGRKHPRELVLKANEAKRGQKRKYASSEFIGVFWNKHAQKWCVRLRILNKYYWVGTFETELEAAHAVDAYVRKRGFSPKLLNFPNECPTL